MHGYSHRACGGVVACGCIGSSATRMEHHSASCRMHLLCQGEARPLTMFSKSKEIQCREHFWTPEEVHGAVWGGKTKPSKTCLTKPSTFLSNLALHSGPLSLLEEVAFNADRHKLGFFLFERCSCHDGRGKKVTGKEHGNGRRMMKGRKKTKYFSNVNFLRTEPVVHPY